MASALWFAFAIALGTLAADAVRAGAKALRWRFIVWLSSQRSPSERVALEWSRRQRNESAR